jgi:hypothetical protein
MAFDADVSSYFRYFEVPALGHCVGNGHPDETFNILRNWVENDIAPDSMTVQIKGSSGDSSNRTVWAYPQVAE